MLLPLKKVLIHQQPHVGIELGSPILFPLSLIVTLSMSVLNCTGTYCNLNADPEGLVYLKDVRNETLGARHQVRMKFTTVIMICDMSFLNFTFRQWPSRLGLQNTLTASLRRRKTPQMSVLVMTLNNLMVRLE